MRTKEAREEACGNVGYTDEGRQHGRKVGIDKGEMMLSHLISSPFPSLFPLLCPHFLSSTVFSSPSYLSLLSLLPLPFPHFLSSPVVSLPLLLFFPQFLLFVPHLLRSPSLLSSLTLIFSPLPIFSIAIKFSLIFPISCSCVPSK